MNNIFISYGREDARELAIRLRDDLRAVGYNVWLDLSQIGGGANWSEIIEQGIENCQILLALMSRASYQSAWCRAEQLRAVRKGKRIIPLLLHADAERPLHLEHLNYIDFTDLARYDALFRDLLSDINSGGAFAFPRWRGTEHADGGPFQPKRRTTAGRTYTDEKRNAAAFRRHIAQLRAEDWLGARYWWPYFLFHLTDIHSVAAVLTADELLAPSSRGGRVATRWDKYVRFYFRPRTPDLYRTEGFRPAPQEGEYRPIPAYLLFDMDALICHPQSCFSDGDPSKTGKTYKTPSHFAELPFEQIYHDSWFMPDEREEIMRCREAQVLVPDRLGLEALQRIWLRSAAEYDTLRALLPSEVWRRWRDKVTHRADYQLFNRKWVYVETVDYVGSRALIRFNPCAAPADCGPFILTARITGESGQVVMVEQREFMAKGDYRLELPAGFGPYQLEIRLDGDLAYRGSYREDKALL